MQASIARLVSFGTRSTLSAQDTTSIAAGRRGIGAARDWDSAPGASDYEIIWRATNSPQWERAQQTGAINKATVKVSKDNVIFGLHALDKAGHAGLPAIPQPPARAR